MGFWGNFFLILIVDADSETYFTVSFNIDVVMIINKIRQNRHIKGIHTQRYICLFQYADDTIMF